MGAPRGVALQFVDGDSRKSTFRADVAKPGLELRDPPRTVQPLLNRLSEATDFEVAITQFEVDVKAWAAAFQRAAKVVAVVDSLQIAALEVERDITAKVLVRGDRDVAAASATLTQGRKYLVEKVQLRLDTPGRGTLVLTSGAPQT